jgi:protein-disulfide isomerase
MASRKEQKEQARQQRLARQQAAAARAQRMRRLQMLGGLAVVAIAVIAVVVVISAAGGGGSAKAVKPQSAAAKAAAARVDKLLAGIPQAGNTLGDPTAPVTVTEYGDLECSVCDMLATPPSFINPEGEAGTGYLDRLIEQFVRPGKVKIVYRSLETASSSNPDPNAFELQQAAAVAAGLQDKEWYYIELFYNEQGPEGANYVTESYLEGLARQVPGLDFAKWMADRNLASVKNQVRADNAAGTAVDGGQASTPTLLIKGPRGTKALPPGLPSSYGQLESAVESVM